jgi:hypothetical protein
VIAKKIPLWTKFALVLWVALAHAPLRASEPDVASDVASPDSAITAQEQLREFEEHVRPLLAARCFKCHADEKQSGSLRVDSRAALLLGGDTGTAIVPREPEQSLLVEAVRYDSLEMPPDGKLSESEIETLTRWIADGAYWPGESGDAVATREAPATITEADRAYWCFQPVRHVEPPVFHDDTWSRNSIDRFVMASLRAKELAPQPEADRLTLIRRVTQTVTGLPPTLAEIDAFLSDRDEGAYERLADRLLESPRRGEHLASFWLDLVRYADSDGYRQDALRPHAWRYRQYVIEAFNSDLPYDRFVRQQLAADELEPDNPSALAATGYLRNGIYEYNQRDPEGQWKAILEDITDTTGDTFLALGVGCAKCHDHKFDPLLQTDYYRLQAFVSNLKFVDERPLATADDIAAYEQQRTEWEAATAEVRAAIAKMEQPFLQELEYEAVKMFTPELQAIWGKADADRTAYERQIAHLIYLQVVDSQLKLDSKFKDDAKTRREELQKQLAEFDHLKPAALPAGPAVADVSPTPSPLFVPGKPRLGDMTPAFLTVLGDEAPTIVAPAAVPESTGRRAALAEWITRPEHPLTARVLVNRIWQQHFGTGLVATPSDFGRLGEPPSHPELLDWLAAGFVENGWSIRWLQREILLSAAFRQASRPSEDEVAMDAWQLAQSIDPANRLLWRFPARRMSGEQIRDGLLAVAGELDLSAPDGAATVSTPVRSVYLQVRRNDREEVLTTFDFPDRITSAGSRNTTTTPTQSLLLINSGWTLDRAQALAQRVEREVGGGDDSRIRHAYRLALGRDPREEELLRTGGLLQALRDAEHQRAPIEVPTRSMLLTGSDALVISDKGNAHPPRLPADNLPQLADFTVEAVVLLDSLYADATVRTIAAHWDSETKHPGWSLGVTSTKSGFQPRNLILQLVGKNASGEAKYEVVPSGIHLELGRPYYVACAVNLDDSTATGVTFTVRDLAAEADGVRTAQAQHTVVSGIEYDGPLVIGGRDETDRHRWDGLIDTVRISAAALTADQLLAESRSSSATAPGVPGDVVAHWTFDDTASRLGDASGGDRTLAIPQVETDIVSPLADFCHVLLNSSEFLYVD